MTVSTGSPRVWLYVAIENSLALSTLSMSFNIFVFYIPVWVDLISLAFLGTISFYKLLLTWFRGIVHFQLLFCLLSSPEPK